MTCVTTTYTCIESRTQLHSVDLDGSRCDDGRHWHRRLPNGGFAGARPQPSVRYQDVAPEPMPIGAPSERTDGER